MVDISKKENMDIIQRFVFNIVMLFKVIETTVTLVTFGGEETTLFESKKFNDAKEIKNALGEVSLVN